MPSVAPSAKIANVLLDSFDGGLNIRDAPTEVAPNETPDCMNVTLDERGGVIARLGITNLNAASLLPQPPQRLYYSTVADALLAYISTDAGNGKLYKSTDSGSTWSAVTTTFTAGALADIIDFKDRVVLVNTLDGVYSYPSTLAAPTHTAGGTANMDEVRGSSITVWQNKLWVTGDIREDATHSKARVWWCNAGNELLWTVASAFIDIRDVDTKTCTAIGAGMGMDVTGKPTMLVYKEQSTYRVNDSTSGSYTTLHSRGAGAAGPLAVASNLGRICSINREGIWVTDGLAVPVRVSDKLQPLFSADGLSLGSGASWSAAPFKDRIVFNIVRAGSSTNDLTLEYHPEIGWTVPHQDMDIGPMTVYSKQTSKLIGAAAASGKVYEMFKTGQDDGANIVSRYQSPWVPVAKGDEARLRYLRCTGRGSVGVQLLEDFSTLGEAYSLTFDQGFGFVWDVDQWDVGLWGNPAIEGNADQPLDQVCKYVSLGFAASTSPPLLGDGSSPEVGAWALYGARFDHIQLET